MKEMLCRFAVSALMAICIAASWNSLSPANNYPPTPVRNFYGDADGNTGITGSDLIQHDNYILSKPYAYDTLQSAAADQTWNTCDVNSDRGCTGLDLIEFQKYLLSQPVTIGARPWALENVDLNLADNAAQTWLPFQINLYSTHATQGVSGRPGISVVVTIDPTSPGSGEISGRSCSPVPGARDQLAAPSSQCALAVTQTDWLATDGAGRGYTESGAYGFAVKGNGNGDLKLNVLVQANPAMDIPAVTLNLTVGFQSYPPFAPTVFSNDGQSVYFMKTGGWWESELWKVQVDGTNLYEVAPNPEEYYFKRWGWILPREDKLIYMEDHYIPMCCESSYIYRADLEGANTVYMEPPHLYPFHWTFSATPNGKVLFMDAYMPGSEMVSEAVLMDVNTFSTTVVTSILSRMFVSFGVSPDGGKIAAVSAKTNYTPPNTKLLHVMNIDGSDNRDVYFFQDEDFYADISHSVSNGWTYFSDLSTARETDIFRIDMTGTIIENLTNTPLASESNPIVRPDQRKILYSSYGTADNYSFWEMDPDGSNKEKLIGFNGIQALNPQYSPDGNTIVYEGGPDLDYDLGIFTRGSITTPTTLGVELTEIQEIKLSNTVHMVTDFQIRRSEAYWNLRALVDAQFAYRSIHGTFTDDASALGWAPLPGYRYSYALGIDGYGSEFYSPEAFTDPAFPGFQYRYMCSGESSFRAVATASLDLDDNYETIAVEYYSEDPQNFTPEYFLYQNDFTY